MGGFSAVSRRKYGSISAGADYKFQPAEMCLLIPSRLAFGGTIPSGWNSDRKFQPAGMRKKNFCRLESAGIGLSASRLRLRLRHPQVGGAYLKQRRRNWALEKTSWKGVPLWLSDRGTFKSVLAAHYARLLSLTVPPALSPHVRVFSDVDVLTRGVKCIRLSSRSRAESSVSRDM